jgi:hypothetical protein
MSQRVCSASRNLFDRYVKRKQNAATSTLTLKSQGGISLMHKESLDLVCELF